MTDDASGLTKRDIEAGRLLFARDVTFMLSAVSLDTLPPARLPEICFAGRSNVGKSSLINALTNVRASHGPPTHQAVPEN